MIYFLQKFPTISSRLRQEEHPAQNTAKSSVRMFEKPSAVATPEWEQPKGEEEEEDFLQKLHLFLLVVVVK